MANEVKIDGKKVVYQPSFKEYSQKQRRDGLIERPRDYVNHLAGLNKLMREE